MWKYILIFLAISTSAKTQTGLTGKHDIFINDNGTIKRQTVLTPLLYTSSSSKFQTKDNSSVPVNPFNNTSIKWSFTDPASIGDFCKVSGNGAYNVTGWNLNTHRVSLYNNSGSTPLWEFPTDPNGFLNYVSISDTGGVIALASFKNIYLFHNTNNVPFFNYDLTLTGDTDIASALDISKDGRFLVCTSSGLDTSRIYGFNTSSATPVWVTNITSSIINQFPSIQGAKLSGNDSLVIINTYGEFFILNAVSGHLIFKGLINPGSPSSGTQAEQGINGDGSIIATINYSGIITIYQRNGNTYNSVWSNQEPPGIYYNWYTAVDITNDGNYIAAGTLNFLTSSSFDGKVKVFKRTGNGTPLWTFQGCGDEVSAVSFSGSGNILAASSWGEFSHSTEDLYIFKTFLGNIPVYKLNTPGSLLYCNTSNDGRTIVSSGKAVHAREFGNGGLLYNIAVDTTDVPPVLINSNNLSLISDYMLYQNYPNPFNPKTIINYQCPMLNYITLKVYDILGNEVATLVNENQNAGNYSVEFNGSNLSSGIYYYKLIAGNFSDTKKFILLK